jgi:uncharacterized delta-60 repeat protein
MHRLSLAALAVAAPLLLSSPALAAPTDLDTAFGVRGRASVGFPGKYDAVNATAPAPDGALIGVGQTGQTSGGMVFRLDRQGALDSGFAIDGIRTLDGVGTLYDAAVQPDGRIVVAGSTSGDAAVARLFADGRLDPSFDGDGVRTINSGGNEYVSDVELQADGKIVVAGRTSVADDGAVYRLNADGSLDSTFDNDGAVGLDSGAWETINALAIQRDGKIVVAGYTTATDGAAVYRLNGDGSLDTTFDGDAALGINAGLSSYAEDLAVQADGRILVAGSGGFDAIVARLERSGALDPTFGDAGIARVDYGGSDYANRIALLPDGRILGAGSTSVGADALLFRLTTRGAPDTSFAPDGVFAFGGGGLDEAEALSLFADGRFVIGGESTADSTQALVYAFLGERRSGGGPGPATPARPSTCNGLRATIVGTPGRDRLRGTPRRDVIAGLGGADVLLGLGGNDVLCGGAGADRLAGGQGRDRLLGGPGKDRLFGGRGRDRLLGGPGRDFVRQ